MPLESASATFIALAKANSSAVLALKTTSLIVLIVGAVFYSVWSYLPVQDPTQYFLFADVRRIWGLDNFWNVFSNVLFLHVSLFGFILFIRNYHAYDLGLWESFLVLNVSVFLTCWGSSYFHLRPTEQTLFWDRLPMSLGFAGLVSFIFADRVTDRYVRILLPIFMLLSGASVFGIDHGPKDIRPYIVIQYGSLLACLIIMLFHRRGRLSNAVIYFGLAFYGLAKVCEHFDQLIFDYFFLSGHTLKHVLAALAVFMINIAASQVHLKIKRDRIL
ncbi:ceramidase [bacterium]|nr:ceramidase [bacterium]